MGPKGFLLALLCCLLHEATAASVAVTQILRDSAPAALEVDGEPSKFYYEEGHRCKKCPPGHRVIEHCTSNTETTCRLCANDTFTKYMNRLKVCLTCRTCRQLDEVELKPCTPTSDTQCACKNGTFCLPSHPCETCRKCTPRCPEGEQMVKPCTPTSNIECVPYATSPTPPTGSKGSVAWIIAVSLIGFLLLAVILWMKFRCCPGAKPRGSTALVCSKAHQWLWRNCSQRQCEEVDNMRNTCVDLESSQSCTHATSRTPEMMPLQTAALAEEASHRFTTETRRDLVPANGKQPIDALRLSFDVFIKEVPGKEWRRYMRALGLTDNEIFQAERSDKDLYEQQFQMLQTWLDRSGNEASLQTLLKTLCDIGLRGVEGNMRTHLISHDLYIYEE